MEITIHEEKLAISHFTGKKGPITSHKHTLYHPLSWFLGWELCQANPWILQLMRRYCGISTLYWNDEKPQHSQNERTFLWCDSRSLLRWRSTRFESSQKRQQLLTFTTLLTVTWKRKKKEWFNLNHRNCNERSPTKENAFEWLAQATYFPIPSL